MFDFTVHEGGIITDEQFVAKEILMFNASQRLKAMLDGCRYYAGKHDILMRMRTAIGANGDLETIDNVPNNRLVDNQYKKMVIQKLNYLLGQPITVQCDNDAYAELLASFFDSTFMKTIKSVGKDALNCGIGWLYPYYNEDGEFTFKRFRPFECIPGWRDAEHTVLDYFIRRYEIIRYVGTDTRVITKVEVYDEGGINYFEFDNGNLIPCEPWHTDYFTVDNTGFNWTKIPIIPFKYNEEEIPLIDNVKSLQDALNTILSTFQNNMEEDSRNSIMVLVNYDGENVGQFRHNLSTYGVVKVKTIDGSGGDVKTLQVEVNSENYKSIIDILKKAIIENCMGYDAKDDRLNGSPNQMNIMSMYNDIDLDTNNMETEFQASFVELLYFINLHLANAGLGNYEGEKVTVIFNRDMLMNEGDIINNIKNSVGILSDETLVANHPWVDDPQAEIEKIKKQKEENVEQYGGAFMQQGGVNDGESEE